MEEFIQSLEALIADLFPHPAQVVVPPEQEEE